MPWPVYRAARNIWFVEIAKKQINIGKHPEGAPPPTKKQGKWDPPKPILDAYFREMARHQEKTKEGSDDHSNENPVEPSGEDTLVVVILDHFLDWCHKHRAGSFDWYRQRINHFCRFKTKEYQIAQLTVSQLRPFHVQEWVDSHPHWSASHKRGSTVAIQRAFRWAEKSGRIGKSPIRDVDKPEAGKRDVVLSTEDFQAIVNRYPDQEFRDLLEFAWHTGARPQEIVRIEKRHFEESQARIVLPPKEAKGKKRYRVIYLDEKALEIVKRLCMEHPSGAIFRNTRGTPWTPWAINCRFNRLQQSLGREALGGKILVPDEEVAALVAKLPKTRIEKGRTIEKSAKELAREARKKLRNKAAASHGKKLFLYAMRHSFAHRMLTVSGVDALTVSTLLGHADGAMLGRVYSHLDQNVEHLRGALEKDGRDAKD
jgi:integrase